MTAPNNISLFEQVATNSIAHRESNQSVLVEEEQWRLHELEENIKFKQLLHGHFKRSPDSDRLALLNNEAPLAFMSKKSRFIKPFV